ncbi:MAG: STAS domain-containing protein [Armatimonadetes bacterium]|nr:STAS domain-containing protein [Armatimonadota bacterium]
METDLDIKIRRAGNVPVIDLKGDVDSYTCIKLRNAIVDLIENGEFRILISMEGVQYIDSAGLGTLIGGLRRTGERNGGMALIGANTQVKKVLSITGLTKVLDLYDNEADAIRQLTS